MSPGRIDYEGEATQTVDLISAADPTGFGR